jgi:CSLREA domain-containing protein
VLLKESFWGGITWRLLIAPVVGLAVACALLSGVARAATVTVNTTSDSPTAGQCSLREAVLYADGTAEPSCGPGTATPPTTITVPAGTYTLTASGLTISADTTIAGAGASTTTISGGNAVQVLNVAAATIATVDGVTITGGLSGVPSTGCTGSGFTRTCPAENGNNGGGIANAGRLTLTDVVVTNNKASAGTLPYSALTFVCFGANCPPIPGKTGGSGGDGGGIYNAGNLNVEDSTVSHNFAGNGASGTNGVSGTGTEVSSGQNGGDGGYAGPGGGIYNAFGAGLAIDASFITGNRAGSAGNAGSGSSATSVGYGGRAGRAGQAGFGGGVASFGSLTVTASTISANTTGTGGNGAMGGSGTYGNGNGNPSSNGGSGGGLFVYAVSAAAHLTNDTVTANATAAGGSGGTASGVGGDGGGIEGSLGVTQLRFVTVADNVAAGNGGGLGASSASLIEADSIVASNSATTASNCSPTVADDGGNLVFGDHSCGGVNADPRLGPLQSNGGPTQTMALGPGSGAIDLVPVSDCQPTDQRGVVRPQGARCDAGAYEFAPPSITAPGAAAGQTTATISAGIDPNLTDTKVVVHYGKTTGYGSSTSVRDIGAGNNASAVRIALSGLDRQRTYHAEIVATNGDGTATSGDLTFTTGVSAAIVSTTTKGAVLKLTLACRGGQGGGRCSGPITVTSRVSKRKGKPVAVAAAAPKSQATRTVIVVAKGRYSLAVGGSRTFKLTLNRTARGLLARFHRLPSVVTVSGAGKTRRVVFATAKHHH